jgi:hypothetical protein
MQAFRAPGSGWCAVNATAERAGHGRGYTKRTQPPLLARGVVPDAGLDSRARNRQVARQTDAG